MITIRDAIQLGVDRFHAHNDRNHVLCGEYPHGHPSMVEQIEVAVAALFRSDLSGDQATPFRWSPTGTLAARSERRVTGWMAPHWVVLQPGPADRHHYVGQRLTDQHVAAWSPLIRKH